MPLSQRSYITTPIRDTDVNHFTSQIEQYALLTPPHRLEAFMRQVVSNRLVHQSPVFATEEAEDGSPDYDVLRISEYELSESNNRVQVQPVDEIAMDDFTVLCAPRLQPSKVIFITNFLGPHADWPLLFIWRPVSERLGLYLPHLPSAPTEIEEQDPGPLINWAGVLALLKSSRQITPEPEKIWTRETRDDEFGLLFTMLVKFFHGQRVHDSDDDEAENVP